MSEVLKPCRTCLKFVDDDSAWKINSPENKNILEMFTLCLSEVDANLLTDPILCEFCLSALSLSYEFKMKCKQTEEHIKNFIKTSNIWYTESLELTLIANKNADEPNADFFARYEEILKGKMLISNDKANEAVVDDGEVRSGERSDRSLLRSYLSEKGDSSNVASPRRRRGKRRTQLLYAVHNNDVILVNGHDYTADKVRRPITLDGDEDVVVVSSENEASAHSEDCLLCNEKFEDKESLNGHLNTEHPNVIYECEECKITYPLYETYKLHVDLHKKGTYKCSECARVFFREVDLRSHIRLTHDQPGETPSDPIQCGYCQERCVTKSDYDKHLKIHELTDTLQLCEKCGKVFSHSGFHIHAQTHNEEKNAICRYCGKGFKYNSLLYKHETTHKARPRYKCDKCPKMFLSRCKLNCHQLAHTGSRPFPCDYCDKTFRFRAQLKEHIQIKHLGERRFPCEFCDERFPRKIALQHHLIRKHGSRDEARVIKQVVRCNSCDKCDKIFTTKTNLQNHVASVHGKDRPFPCQECEKSYATKDLRLKHTLLMHGTRAQCELCQKWFRNKFHLRTHFNTHTSKVVYSCEVCGQGFTAATNRNRHRKIHNKEGILCVDCYKRFDSVSELEEHRKSHTAKKYKCELCDEEFSRRFALVTHQQKRHGDEGKQEEVFEEYVVQEVDGKIIFKLDNEAIDFDQVASVSQDYNL